MSKWSDAVDAELQELYAQVPDVGCQGLCADSCGPIDMGAREAQRLKQAGALIPRRDKAVRLLMESHGEWSCPALDAEGRCGVYAIRPMICRIWGASEGLPCPYGCRAADGALLSPARAHALVDAAMKAGTDRRRIPEEHFQDALDSPEGQAIQRERVRKPVRDRKASRRRRGLG